VPGRVRSGRCCLSLQKRQLFTGTYQSAILGGMAATLLVFLKDLKNPVDLSSPKYQALLAFSYGAVIFNACAAVAALFITSKISRLGARAASITNLPQSTRLSHTSLEILKLYGAGNSFTYALVHCKLQDLFVGMF
jgi:hypothetical protein